MPYVHTPVLLSEILHYLACRPGGTYVDGTLGGGGHARAILAQSAPDGTLIGIDQDQDAILNARAGLKAYAHRLHLVHDNFAHLPAILARLNIPAVDGIVLDLGLSQHHLAASGRGFSFLRDEPLDMRMDIRQEQTAADIVNNASLQALADLFRRYGQERHARRIARRLVTERQQQPIRTSGHLARIVAQAVGRAASKRIHPATRVFMALRIAVNGELDRLTELMEVAATLLLPRGRLCVVSFHSLEDRIVKHGMRALAAGCTCPPRLPQCVCERQPAVSIITRKARKPRQTEVKANPLARSARLRVMEKLPFEST